MARPLLFLITAAVLGGCSAHAPPPSASTVRCGSCGKDRIPVDTPAAVEVPDDPPPPRQEPFLFCTGGQTYVDGHWDWGGEWYWVAGFCSATQPGYVYVRPFYGDGVYVGGYFAQAGASLVAGARPQYRRYEHPEGTVLRSDPTFWLPYYARYGMPVPYYQPPIPLYRRPPFRPAVPHRPW